MTSHFVTYFDSHYAAQGIAMLQSLRAWCPGATVTVLCLDDTILRILKSWFPEGLHTLTIAEVLESEPRLVPLRESRTPWEFFATMKPILIRQVMNTVALPGEWFIFTDADTYYFSSPLETISHIPKDVSTVMMPNRFGADTLHLRIYGNYCAGFGLWRCDAHARAVLDDWSSACIDWCFSRVEQGRFMNQGYLNEWPKKHDRIMILGHPGFNLAPWNLGSHRILETPAGVLVDNMPLVFFHFSSVSRTVSGSWQTFYTYPEMSRPAVLDGIYAPYLDTIEAISSRLLEEHQIAGVGSLRKVDPATPMLTLRAP